MTSKIVTGGALIASPLLICLCPAANAQSSASITFAPLGPLAAYDSPTSSGWGTGSQAYTAVGLNLDWVSISDTLGTPTPDPDLYTYQITNVADLTTLDLNRYLSFTFDPRSALGSSSYTLTALNSLKTFNRLAPGENFQIRTSYDNFASALVDFAGVDGTTTGTVAPGTASNAAFYQYGAGMTDPISAPLEIRFYYYGTNLDGSPTMDSYGAGVGAAPYTLAVGAIPEASSMLLFGAASAFGLLHRKRPARA